MTFHMRLDSRCQSLLESLMEASDYIGVSDISKEKNVSKRSVYYDLCKINDWLELHNISRLEIERSKGIYMSAMQKEMIENVIEDSTIENSCVLSPMERIRIIICMVIYSNESIYIEDIMKYCDVSRNTIFNDLKVVTNRLQEYDLRLVYEIRKGYRIRGDVIRKRAIFFLNFNMLLPLFKSGKLKFLNKKNIEDYLQRLKHIETSLNMRYVEGMLLSLAALLPVMIKEGESFELKDVDLKQIEDTQEYNLVCQYFLELIPEEKFYLSLHLLGSRIQTIPIDFMKSDQDKEVYELVKALVSEFKKIACVEFDKQEEIERSLFVHLKASLYRYRYGIQLGNPLIDDIVKEYPILFEITKRASEYLEQQIGVPIPDTEIAYLTLHFGGFLRSSTSKSEILRILIVCPNGISTGNMLKGEISSLLPNAEVMDAVSLCDLEKTSLTCDLVISTVKVESDVPVIVVHPILTDTDRIAILKRSISNASLQMLPTIDAQSLFHLVSKYVDKLNHKLLRRDIEDYLQVSQKNIVMHEHRMQKGMMQLLDERRIQICDEEMNWQHAIQYTANVLLREESIHERYIFSILSHLQYYGPYMFIAPNIVLAHAKPEEGTIRLDIAMCVCKKDVHFSPHHVAKIILILSPIDHESHLHILRDIMSIFSIQTNVDSILQLSSIQEISQFLKINLE